MRSGTLVCCLAFLGFAACESEKPKGDLPPLHPVKGKLVRGGSTVSGGAIRLTAESGAADLMINGDVGADGSFELRTIHAVSQKMGTGAPAGTYKVTYYPVSGDQTAGGVPSVIDLPDRVTIKEGSNELTIDLGKKK